MTATEPEPQRTDDDAPGPEQGGGPPEAYPWTLVVDDEEWSADLEHGAPVPRVGERIEYITERGARRYFRVRDVVHTVQASASERPPVRDEPTSPNATVSGDHEWHVPVSLRVGLPRVCVTAEEPDEEA